MNKIIILGILALVLVSGCVTRTLTYVEQPIQFEIQNQYGEIDNIKECNRVGSELVKVRLLEKEKINKQ